MAAAAADRLSVLPDAVLHRILSYAPAKDAAATSALSRRWRPLWRRTTCFDLDSGRYSPQPTDSRYYSNDVPKYDAFFRDAHAAFRQRCLSRTRSRQIQRLTLFLEIGTYRLGKAWWHRRRRGEPEPEDDGRVAGLLSDPAVAELEELRISCQQALGIGNQVDYYSPQLASLPCAATLRVLELRWCKLDSPPPPLALQLPRLTGLHLHDCFLQEGGTLQVLADAAPELTSLSLVDVLHKAPAPADGGSTENRPYYDHDTSTTYVRLPLRLRCPALTAFLLQINVSEKDSEPDADSGIALDMPSLRFFRYRGFPVKLSLTSSAPALELVDVDASRQGIYFWKLEPVSRMLRSFSSMRTLKLRLHLIEDIVVAGDAEEGGVIQLPTFPNLKLLELDAEYQYMKSDTTAVAMAWLLRSCPAMAELRLRLNMQWDYGYDQKAKAARPVGGPFGKSMERFQRLASMSTTHRSVVELGEVSELPDVMTSNCTFSCLRTSLRKVTLQFEAKEVNCFQVQLAKFLAENAMVLEEMHVDNGSWFWLDHLCHKVARWRAESFKRRNLMDTAGFRVYQLDSPVVDSAKPPGYDSD